MGCMYSDQNGNCNAEHEGLEDNICIYEDDPNPTDSCEDYESDYMCSECGIDLNVDECTCE